MNNFEILNTLTYLGAAFVLFLIGKFTFKITHPKLDVNHVLLEDDNVAFAASMTGYYAAIICVLGGAIIGPQSDILTELIDIFSYGLLAIVLLQVSAIINERLLFPKFNIKKEILTDRNLGTGVIEGANYLATGIILYGAIIGEGGGYHTALAFWIIAQVLFWLASKLYQVITPYNIHEEIEKDNVAVGVGFAGALIAIALLIKTGIQGDFVSWQESLFTIAIDTSAGFILLPLARFLTDKILLPTRSLTDEIVNQEHPNVGAALIEAFAYIGGAVLISWSL